MDTHIGAMFGIARAAYQDVAWCTNAYTWASKCCAESAKQDKCNMLRGKIRAIENAARSGANAEMHESIKWFSRKPRRMVQGMGNADGQRPSDNGEVAANTHNLINGLMAGTTMSLADHIAARRVIADDESPLTDLVSRHPAGMSALSTISLQFSRAKAGKALGPAMESPELFRLIPAQMAALYDPTIPEIVHIAAACNPI